MIRRERNSEKGEKEKEKEKEMVVEGDQGKRRARS
jgi:hypothetical protein